MKVVDSLGDVQGASKSPQPRQLSIPGVQLFMKGSIGAVFEDKRDRGDDESLKGDDGGMRQGGVKDSLPPKIVELARGGEGAQRIRHDLIKQHTEK